MSWLAVLLALVSAVVSASVSAEQCSLPKGAVTGSVVKNELGQLAFSTSMEPGAVALGVYVDSADTVSNFGKLRVTTSAEHSDFDQMSAAGFLEGYLTAARINDHHHNLKHYFINQLGAELEQPMQWIKHQEHWLKQQAAAHKHDPFWQVVVLLQAQVDGLYEGYAAAMTAAEAEASAAGKQLEVSPLGREDIIFLNSNGELYDLLDMYDSKAAQAKLDSMTADELYRHVALQGKCSALIKVTADLSDILFGHSTWDSFTAMTRIYKHYQFNLQQVSGGVAAQALSFSSYPGEVFSDDDFYITSSKLVVLETTNHIYNFTILESLSHASVPSWLRVRAANLLASNGSSWVSLFRRHNSGTYNNQYMVLDLKRFQPGYQLQAELLWVVEQLPGMVEAADLTEVLARGYFPSYNVALFPSIYKAAGYPDLVERARAKGPHYDAPTRWLMYQISPRAEIFRRDQGGLEGLADIKRLMRYNDYQADKLSGGHPYASVCARGDLAAKGAIPKGCYDSKVTNYHMALAMESEVVGGPTAQGQPVFEWGNDWPGFEHQGMPERFDFQFEKQSAADLPVPGLECNFSTAVKASTAARSADTADAVGVKLHAAAAAGVQDDRPLPRSFGPPAHNTNVAVA
eukprot:gene11811-11955_t